MIQMQLHVHMDQDQFGALLVGVGYAKALSYTINKPLVGVNHIEGHIAANYITFKELEPEFLCLIISGGHTHLVKIEDYTKFEILGKTKDDAIGEAFDKVARVIGLTYPRRTKNRQTCKKWYKQYRTSKSAFRWIEFQLQWN